VDAAEVVMNVVQREIFHRRDAMGLILLLVVLVLLFGGGGFYMGAPYHYYGGGLGTILIIVIVVLLLRGWLFTKSAFLKRANEDLLEHPFNDEFAFVAMEQQQCGACGKSFHTPPEWDGH
jgi:hypothetical protein